MVQIWVDRMVPFARLLAIGSIGIIASGTAHAKLSAKAAPDERPAIAKLYVETRSQILGFRIDDTYHAERVCKMYSGYNNADIAADKNGNLLQPMSGAEGVQIFDGSQMCGKNIGRIDPDANGYPVDAASLNALSGRIVFASIPPFSLSGGVFVCRLSGECSTLYTGQPSNGGDAISVAMDGAGDCWATLPYYPTSGSWALEYFRGCRQDGVVASGWINPAGGGLDVDPRGNLVSISSSYYGGTPTSVLYVYRGCKPRCVKIGGPFKLGHGAIYGHLSRDGSLFASTGDGFVDVYAYGERALTPKLTFATGSDNSYGVTFTPGR